VQRLEHKAPGRVERINPAYTGQTCSACKSVDRKARESQAVFRCRSCRHTEHADVNAAKNIAAGRAVTARGGPGLPEPVNREPQLVASFGEAVRVGIPVLQGGEDVKSEP
jgi:transposase